MHAPVTVRRELAVTAALALVCALSVGAQTASAQEAVQLRRNAENASRWAFVQDRATRLKIDILTGGQVVQTMDNEEVLHLAGESQVLAVAGGYATKMRVAFSPGCTTQAKQNGQATAAGALPVAGKTYRIARGSAITYDGDPSAKDPKVQEILKDFVDDPKEDWFPPRPLRVGETWQAPDEAVRHAFDLKPGDRGRLVCTLAGLEQGPGGRQIAKLRLQVTLQQKLQGVLDMTAKLKGEASIDVPSGRPLSLSLTGPLQASGRQTQQGPDGNQVAVQLKGSGQLSVRTSAKRLGSAPPPNPLAGGQTPGQVTPGQTPGQVGPGQTPPPNPLGKGGGTPPQGGGWGQPKPPTGGGWGKPDAPRGPDLSTPRKAWEALSASLKGDDFAAFRSLHTARIQARLQESDFRNGKTMLQRYGLPPIKAFDAQPDQSVKVTLQNGNVLTVLRKEGGGYRADTIWTR